MAADLTTRPFTLSEEVEYEFGLALYREGKGGSKNAHPMLESLWVERCVDGAAAP